MAWLPAFFICSAIIASVQGLPGITRYLDKDFYSESQRENERQIFQHRLVKGKIPIPSIEFIYQDQNKHLKAHKGTDQERYMNNSNFIALKNDKKNKIGTISQSDSKDNFTEIVNTNESNTTASSKIGISSFMNTFKQDKRIKLNKKESITRSLPKYFYGILPISTFPGELPEPKETIVLKKDKLNNSGVPVILKTFQPIQIAGPMLFPQSTYAREFDLPFFD